MRRVAGLAEERQATGVVPEGKFGLGGDGSAEVSRDEREQRNVDIYAGLNSERGKLNLEKIHILTHQQAENAGWILDDRELNFEVFGWCIERVDECARLARGGNGRFHLKRSRRAGKCGKCLDVHGPDIPRSGKAKASDIEIKARIGDRFRHVDHVENARRGLDEVDG